MKAYYYIASLIFCIVSIAISVLSGLAGISRREQDSILLSVAAGVWAIFWLLVALNYVR